MTNAELAGALAGLKEVVDTTLDSILAQLGDAEIPQPVVPEFNKTKFFGVVRDGLGKINQSQVQGLEFIIDRLLKEKLLTTQQAYILATAYWESGRSFQPVRESPVSSDAWRKKNLRYYPWYGRGLVQLTHESNYRRAGRELGKDFIANPDAVMEPEAAYAILVKGMTEGWFTTLRLDKYVNASVTDYKGARRVVNGTDRDDEIAQLARMFEQALTEAGK